MLDDDRNTAIAQEAVDLREPASQANEWDEPLDLLNDIYRYALGRLGAKEDAEDATMETFIAVHTAPHRWQRAREPRLYLFGIASRKIADILRQRRPLPQEPVELPENEDAAMHQRQAIEQVLGQLPDSQREVLILKYLYEFSVQEISQIIRKSPLAVNSLLQRAREGFRSEASDAFGDDMLR